VLQNKLHPQKGASTKDRQNASNLRLYLGSKTFKVVDPKKDVKTREPKKISKVKE
jgi:hypothetical protein